MGLQLLCRKRCDWTIFHHYLLVVVMTVSRIFVKLGKKLCLFVYYVEQIYSKDGMAKEVATFNGSVESKMVHDNIRRRNREQCGRSVWFFLIMFQKSRNEAY